MKLFTDWLSEGQLIHQVFRIVALVGLGMGLLQLLVRLIGFDDGSDAEGIDHEGGSIFSWTTLAGFTLGFGAVGSMLMSNGMGVPAATIGGAIAGIGIGGLFLFLMRFFHGLKEDNTFRIENCIDKIGTAYVRIPAGGSGGQIQIVAQSRMVTLHAISEEEISSGERVKVLSVIGPDQVKVEKV